MTSCLGARGGVTRQQRRIGARLLQVLNDGQLSCVINQICMQNNARIPHRLGQHQVVDGQRWDLPQRIHLGKLVAQLQQKCDSLSSATNRFKKLEIFIFRLNKWDKDFMSDRATNVFLLEQVDGHVLVLDLLHRQRCSVQGTVN